MWKRWISLVLLALALTGAPFGMGRMMDAQAGVPAAGAHAGMAGMKHCTSGPAGSAKGTPVFMMCAACAASIPEPSEPVRTMTEADIDGACGMPFFDGVRFLPPTPPPRA